MRSHSAALVALHVSVILFGFAGLFGKWLTLSPTIIVLGRTVVAAATLAAIMLSQRRAIGRPDLSLAINGLILALHWVAFFLAIQIATVAIGLLGFATCPLFVLALERVALGRHFSVTEGATAIAVCAGLVLLVPDFSWSNPTLQGLAWGVLSGFTFALLAVRNRARVQRDGALALALWQNAFAAFYLVPWVLTFEASALTLSARDIVLLIVLGAVCTALAHSLFIASMRRLTAHTASIIAALEPVYGIALAALLLGEYPDGRTLVGAGLIIFAAGLASRRALAG